MFYFNHRGRKSSRPQQLHPNSLSSVNAQMLRYLQKSELGRIQTDVPLVWKFPFGPEVIEALKKLSFQKCPFCERSVSSLQPFRFRPPAGAEPTNNPADKSCYLWLSFHWDNLFPICDECIPQKKSYFPVTGARAALPDISDGSMARIENGPGLNLDEKAVIIYPGELLHPHEHFDVTMEGILVGTGRVEQTVMNYSLNRPSLVEARRLAIEDFIDDLLDAQPFRSRAKDPFAAMPFGGTLALLLRKILTHFVQSPLGEHPVQDVAREQSTRVDFAANVDRAVKELRSKDNELRPRERVRPPLGSTVEPPAPQRLQAPIMPRLSQIRVQNFRSIDELTLVVPEFTEAEQKPAPSLRGERVRPTTPCLLILGENASGKSSILEAIALGCLSQSEIDELNLDAATIPLKPSFMGAPELKAPTEAQVSLRFSDGSLRSVQVPRAREKISVSNSGVVAHQPIIFAYGARRLYGRGERGDAIRHIDTLFHPERHLSNPEPWLIRLWDEQQPDALGEVISALRHVIEIDGEFDSLLVEDDDGERHCFLKIHRKLANETKLTVHQRLDVASSGYRAVLAVLCDIFQGLIEISGVLMNEASLFATAIKKARLSHAIVLIDEIEAHMHPRWKLGIVAGLRKVFPNITFILTSHDPLCVRGMIDREVVMMNRYFRDGPGLKERVECIGGFGDLSRMTVEQLLTSNLFQLFSTDDSEVDRTYSELATLLGQRRESLTPLQASVLEDFENSIGEAMPYGKNDVSLVVQRAVAAYIAARREMRKVDVDELRLKAERSIIEFLAGLQE